MNPVRFGDKYILLDQIGAGGVAEVFRGKLTREKGFEKLIVIKKLLPEYNASREMVDIFISEARLAALLQHENIAATYDFGELDGEYFLAMEYLFGKNLHSMMARVQDNHDLFTPGHALAVCSRICEGMEYAHNLTDLQNKPLNLVHRDLTPHNIFITYDGKVKILDFGVAKAELFDNKTREGVVKGKISYMSPERLSGEDVDSRSDIFSIGILLYEMVGKTRMYQGDTAELIRKCLTADFENLKTIVPGLDPRIYAILDKALAVDVAQRYQSCAEMQADMDDLLFDMEQRPDSKFLKDSIQQLFAREFGDEQDKVAALFTEYGEDDLQEREKTGILVSGRNDTHAASDRTVVLAYQPALQLIKSTTADVRGWLKRGVAKSRSLVDGYTFDRRHIWGAAGVAAGIALLIGVLQSGEKVSSDLAVTGGQPAAETKAEEADMTPAAEPQREAATPAEAEKTVVASDEIAPPADKPVERVEPPPQPAPVEQEPPPPLQTASVSQVKVPVLKSREMKIKKQITASPVPGDRVAVYNDARPAVRGLDTLPEKPPVDVTGQTMSFEEEAENNTRRRNIIMLHTRAEEAMQQGRLMEPVQQSAYRYYTQILELDPVDVLARDGLRQIGDQYAAVAETALAAKQFDKAAEHVADGLKAMPDYPQLAAIDERIKRERADHIHELSEKARLCLDAGKLSTPANDSAYHYYSEILRLDPDNDRVQKGFHEIADKYASLADQAFREFDYDQADRYVRQGLQVVPNHYYLLSLKQELERSDLERVGHSVKKQINKLFSE